MSETERLCSHGYMPIGFEADIAHRAEYTKLGNQLIDLVMNDDKIREALTFNISDRTDKRGRQAGMYGVSPAMNSADAKLWLHAGYQTIDHVNATLPKSRQPTILIDFLTAHAIMMQNVENSFRNALNIIGADEVAHAIFDADTSKRQVHVRVVRYIGARKPSSPNEPVSGHADMDLCTLHLFETHGNWFHGAPYAPEIMSNEETDYGKQQTRIMRSKLELIQEIDEQAVFFLGAGWHSLPKSRPPKEYQTLPACYHAGIRPKPNHEITSPFAADVVTEPQDRVSLVVFAQPSLTYAKKVSFEYPSVAVSRPTY